MSKKEHPEDQRTQVVENFKGGIGPLRMKNVERFKGVQYFCKGLGRKSNINVSRTVYVQKIKPNLEILVS